MVLTLVSLPLLFVRMSLAVPTEGLADVVLAEFQTAVTLEEELADRGTCMARTHPLARPLPCSVYDCLSLALVCSMPP